jgi:molecular chaperone DnaK
MGRAIGIDLGTTNSCAAVVLGGTPQVITYPNGAKTIPSVFAIDKSGARLTGEEARNQAVANPMNTVAASKRLIGRSFGSKAVEQMSQVFTYELVEGEGSSVLVRVADQVLTLEQISAAILMRIKNNAEAFLGQEVDKAVITVPAYFNDRQRQAVRTAGRLAGLHVLRVLNEPTAAALAYGLGRTLDQRVAIYDLGGGTFDISVIDIHDKVFEVVATGGDTFLGGVDFDDRIMQWVLSEFLRMHDIDLSYDRSAITRIRDSAESAKIDLSKTEESRIILRGIATRSDGTPIDLEMRLTREQLEELTMDLVDRSITTCERIFEEAGTNRLQIDELLLVGGQSRMPLVRRKLQRFLGREPSEKVHPDEAVAIGAAIMAKSLSSKVDSGEVKLHDVLPVPIGISKPDGTMHVLFKKNSELPAKKTKVLTTSKDGQKTLVLRMYQGDSPYVEDCELLGSFMFHGLRNAPRGDVRLEVTFHIDSEGILNLSARDKDTGEQIQSRIKLERQGDGQKKRRRKKKKPTEPAAEAPALDMPSSSLMADDDDDAPVSPAKAPAKAPEATPAPAPEPVAAPAASPSPDLSSLRSQMQRPVTVNEEKGSGGGFFGWLKRLFGIT